MIFMHNKINNGEIDTILSSIILMCLSHINFIEGDWVKVLIMSINLRADWVHSLKEKRMIIKSITQKLKNKFNISVNEILDQDVHQSIVIGISSICSSNAQVDSVIENIINFIESNTDAELVRIQQEVIPFNFL